MADPIEATREASTIRKARPDEVDSLARTLARAFYDDPVARWMLPRDERRMSQLERAFEIGLNGVFMREGECWTTDGVVGGAIWQPPGRWRVPAGRQLRLLVPMALVYRGDLLRALGAFQALEREHPHDRDHWYLPFIGVDPQWQGKGLGTALLRPILDRCDSAGLPAYLEASTPRNRTCYERNGFEVVGTLTHRKGPTMWKMWREPGG
jgi:ribosomal protein S18 acetylase RimI-like enzyme